jgi:biopolymer transport protein TolQ
MLLNFVPIANAWLAYTQSGSFGKGIVIAQIIFSMCVWCVMLERGFELLNERRRLGSFRQKFSSARGLLDIYLDRRARSEHSAMSRMYRDACDRIASLLPIADGGFSSTRLSRGRQELVKATLEESLSRQTLFIERNMWVLALGASIAPLVGLFGTVWGIMQAFQSMALSGSVQLSDVAPGLSSALLTTVVGLVVAIPSSIGYSMILEQVRAANMALDAFADEFLARMGIELGSDSN